MRLVPFAIPAIALAATVSAQSSSRPQILVLGTYHMASPVRDLFNSKVDDVMAPKRQQEIVALMEVLKRFRPTKVAIEANVNSRGAKREYKEYHGIPRGFLDSGGARYLFHKVTRRTEKRTDG